MKNDIYNLKINNGESFQDEKKRVIFFLKDLKKLNSNNILIVSHQEVIQIIGNYFNNLSDSRVWEMNVDNCDVLEFEL